VNKRNAVYYSKKNRVSGHEACMEEMGNAHRIFVGKPEGKRPLGRHMRRWEYKI